LSSSDAHDPEKWEPVFGKDHAREKSTIPKKPVLDLIGDGNRFPAFAKPASAGEGRSEKIMRKEKK
jgi:hypothetical protein